MYINVNTESRTLTQMDISVRQKHRHSCREHVWTPRGGRSGMDRETGVDTIHCDTV